MKALLFSIFFIPAVLFAQDINQTDANGKKHGKWIKTWPKSTIKVYEGTFNHGVPQGKFMFWYEGGKPQAIIKYAPNGSSAKAQFYHEVGGEVMAIGNYINKEKDSTWTYFDQKGRLSMREDYVDGKLNGDKIVYFVDPNTNETNRFVEGRIYQQMKYKDGLLHGVKEEYYPDGKLKSKYNYVDGNKDGVQYEYHLNGRIERSVMYKFAVKDGFTVIYDKTGKIIKKIYYHQGFVLEGEQLERFLAKQKK